MENLDYVGTGIVIGEPKDWYKKNENGEILSVDADGTPIPDQEIWAEARKTGNGAIPGGYTIGGSFVAVAKGYGFKSPQEGILQLRNSKNYRKEAGRSLDMSTIFDRGHACEKQIAEMAMAQINEKHLIPNGLWGTLIDDQRMFRAGQRKKNGELKYPHVIADMDRVIAVHAGTATGPILGYYLMEVKSVQFHGFEKPEWIRDEKKNPYGQPAKYQDQQHLYMGVCTGFLGSYLVAGQDGSLRSKDDILVRFLPYDQKKSERVLKVAEDFAKYAESGAPANEYRVPKPDETVKCYGEYAFKKFEKNEVEGSLADEEALKKYIIEHEKEAVLNKRKNMSFLKAEKQKEKAQSILIEQMDGREYVKVLMKEGTELPTGEILKEDAWVHITCTPKEDSKEIIRFYDWDAEGVRENLPSIWEKVGHILDGKPVISTSGVKLTAAEKADLSPYKKLTRSGKVEVKYYIEGAKKVLIKRDDSTFGGTK